MEKHSRFLIFVGIAALIILFGYLFLFLIGPIMLAGPPCSLYYITNDSTEDHTIVVEIFDENNISVLKEAYNLSPGKYVKYDRGIGWYPKTSWYLITWSDGTYIFYFSLDNKYSEKYTMDVFPTCSVNIELFYEDYQTNEIIPIYIRESCI